MRKKLLILCYHGFEITNESQFRPQLFITKETFEKRLKLLSKSSANVLPLDEAVKQLENNSLANNSVVITIDDGFYSVFAIAFPLLQRYGFPTTLYQTTMDMQKGRPILHLLIAYMVETTPQNKLNTSQYKWGTPDIISLNKAEDKKKLIESCLSLAGKLDSTEEIESFCIELGDALGIDYANVRDSRLLTLLNESELTVLATEGIDIQLHTHSHRFPQNDVEKATFEIQKNRSILEHLSKQSLVHFCYPSGDWSTAHWPVLLEAGIKSATTCTPGLNDAKNNLLALNRFLDGENISEIVFEAEVYRFNELMRLLKRKFKKNDTSLGTL